MEDPLAAAADDEPLGPQDPSRSQPYSLHSLLSLTPPHPQPHPPLPHLHDLHRHRRFVVTHSMIEEGRFNIALLIVFILCIFLINAFFIAVILLSKTLRANSKHILVLSVAFADLLLGLLILPLITDIGNKDRLDFDCTTFQVRSPQS